MKIPYHSKILFHLLVLLILGCSSGQESTPELEPVGTDPYLIVLGIAQDAGYPQVGCSKVCCRDLWENKAGRKKVTCLGLIDPLHNQAWLFEATPDFREQLYELNRELTREPGVIPDGIFLSHAHMGHYTGLMHLGREAMGANAAKVWAMPRMKNYLEQNGPWSQLVDLQNIHLQPLQADSLVILNDRLRLQAFTVPHRDEFSETVGFRIIGPQHQAIFIPDIDKWERWEQDINEQLKKVDLAFLDGTFYANGEIPGRDMALIPHPFIEESRQRFSSLPSEEKQKVYFIHFNHTNPVLRAGVERASVLEEGFSLAEEGFTFDL